MLDLQARRELTIIQASGRSIWSITRAPLLLTFVLVGLIATGGDTLLILGDRLLPGHPINRDAGVTWLEQHGKDGDYILRADRITADPPAIYGVSIFMSGANNRDRIEAPQATLSGGSWLFADATLFRLDRSPLHLTNFQIATQTTYGDLNLQASGVRDRTLPELFAAAMTNLSVAEYRAASLTSLFRTFTMPILVMGTMLVGFAVASGYRRNVQYGSTVLLGIVMGFAVFTINEMAIRAGSADVLPPLWAMAAPAIVSVIAGLTALLYSQDGNLRAR